MSVPFCLPHPVVVSVLYVSFGCVAMGSALLCIFRSRLLIYAAWSGVNRVQVVLSIKIEASPDLKKVAVQRNCKVRCTSMAKYYKVEGLKVPKHPGHMMRYECRDCQVSLCVDQCFNPFLPRSAVVCRRGLQTQDAGACLTRLRTRSAVACLVIENIYSFTIYKKFK